MPPGGRAGGRGGKSCVNSTCQEVFPARRPRASFASIVCLLLISIFAFRAVFVEYKEMRSIAEKSEKCSSGFCSIQNGNMQIVLYYCRNQ